MTNDICISFNDTVYIQSLCVSFYMIMNAECEEKRM